MGSKEPNVGSRPIAGQVPAWTYRLGALIAGLTLAWTVASHFVPRAEAPPPPKPSAATVEVHAVGPGSVGIGVMTDGHIKVGEVAPAVAKAASGPR
jgi:hypothetical protein